MTQDTVSKMCSLPLDFKAAWTKNMFQLLNETGYFENETALNKEAVINQLRLNPGLISAWVGYSEDQRTSPAWALERRSDLEWIVKYLGSNPKVNLEQRYVSGIEACATFILLEISTLKELLICYNSVKSGAFDPRV
jgi:hypothetical protein